MKQLKTPLHDAAAVNATRNGLFKVLLSTGLPVSTGTGSQTKFNRVRLGVPKTHALDAACVGDTVAVYQWNRKHLSVKCTGRGRYQRTQTDKYGFPRQYAARLKYAFGFQTGDLVRATRPKDRKTYVGRATVRQTGVFTINQGVEKAPIMAMWHCCVRLQRADGYNYKGNYVLSNQRLVE